MATGLLAYPYIQAIAKKAMSLCEGLQVHVYAIKNEFFGEKITVSGLITGQDLLNSEKLLFTFYQRMEEINQNAKIAGEKISVAAGMAIFRDGLDTTYQSVFKRADEKMYQNKVSIKSGNGPIFDIERFEA